MQLVADQIYDKISKLFNDRRKRLAIKGGNKIVEPIIDYDNFNPDDNGNLNIKYGKEDIYIGHINEGLNSPSNMINPSCMKVFGTHTFYKGGLSRTPPPVDLKNGRLYKLQLWQAIRTIYDR